MLLYPVVFLPDEEYIMAFFPDIPEAFTEGDTLKEAYEMAMEVLGFALEDYKKTPPPSTIQEIQTKYPDGQVALIGIDMIAYRRKYHSKTVRKNVTIPEWLDELASKENINFSSTLTEALKEKLNVS